jgi:hypothetical protein
MKRAELEALKTQVDQLDP